MATKKASGRPDAHTPSIDPAIFDDPKLLEMLRPRLIKLLAELGIAMVVDEATGEVGATLDALAKAFGMSEAEILGRAGRETAISIPVDRMRFLQ
jgi:hypothetical protein